MTSLFALQGASLGNTGKIPKKTSAFCCLCLNSGAAPKHEKKKIESSSKRIELPKKHALVHTCLCCLRNKYFKLIKDSVVQHNSGLSEFILH